MITDISFQKLLFASNLKPEASGVEIYLDATAVTSGRLILYGKFQLTKVVASNIDAVNLHKALVITSVVNGFSQTRNLIGDMVLFADDIELIDDCYQGCFKCNLYGWVNMPNLANCYLTVSMHDVLSNTIIFSPG